MATTQQLADELYEDMHDLSVAVAGRAVPAPELYGILGDLKSSAGYFAAELLGRLADGIEKSIDEYDVYEDDGTNPASRAALAASLMQGAASHAESIARYLEAAQSAVGGQGHNGLRADRPVEPACGPTVW